MSDQKQEVVVEPRLLEVILSKHCREHEVAKILSVEAEAVVAKGDNYASELWRLVLDVILGSGERTKKSIIYKRLPVSEYRQKQLGEMGLFKKEIKMYRDILPLMEKVLREKGDESELLWGKCIAYDPYTSITLEDLRAQGYKMADRRKGLDLEHSKLAVMSFARFHAMSIVLKERGMFNPEDFVNPIFNGADDMIGKFYEHAFTSISQRMESTWEPEWKSYAEALRNLAPNVMSKLKTLYDTKPSSLNVLNHGDSWVNNMLFKYHPFSDKPVGIRLIDFQLSYYHSFAFDLVYFFCTSPDPEVKKNNQQELLKVYLNTLEKAMDFYGPLESKPPTLEEAEKEIKAKGFFSLVIGATLLPMMTLEPDDVPDLEETIKGAVENQEMNWDVGKMMGKNYTNAFKQILLTARQNGII